MMEMMSKILAVVALAGFAIQQILELLSPFVSLVIRNYVERRTATTIILTEVELKKWWMAFFAFLLGVGAVVITKISLLKFIDTSWENSLGDLLVTALVLGAGTEGLNTLSKYFGYIKEGKKAALTQEVKLVIIPSSVTVGHGKTFQFRSIVRNAPNAVIWEVAHGSGGSIDTNGRYTAPGQAGTYNIMAVSEIDETKHAIATVKVT